MNRNNKQDNKQKSSTRQEPHNKSDSRFTKQKVRRKSGSVRANNKKKGNRYEVSVRNDLIKLGLAKTRTSREASTLYDDCGIDHWGALLPNGAMLLTQCKAGYKNNRPRADVEFKNQITKLKKFFPENSLELNPENLQVLFHKIDGYHKHNHLVTVTYETFMKLLKSHYDRLLSESCNKSESPKGPII